MSTQKKKQKKDDYEKQFGPRRSLLELLVLQVKILCFQADEEELHSLGKHEYFWGIVLVWLAGIARFSSNPTASLLARSGMESVFYVYFLAMYLWVLMALIGARNFKFGRLIIFIGMTAPPALLFAIPFKSFCTPYIADQIGTYLYLGIAIWRVALFAWFTHKIAELTPLRIGVALFLPLAFLVNSMQLWEDLKAKYSKVGGVRRELKKITVQAPAMPAQVWSGSADQQAKFNQQALAFLDEGSTGAPPVGMPPGGQRPATQRPAVSRPVARNPAFIQHRPGQAHRRNVTSGATGWLSKQGAQLAERPDAMPGMMKMQLAKPPEYQETVNTPEGPVQVYWMVGTPDAPVPLGYEEITDQDPIQGYRDPIAKLFAPVAPVCWFGSFAAGIAYFVFIFMRPKRDKDQPETDEEEDEESEQDEEDEE